MPETNTIFSRGDAERGQGLLHLGEDRVVAAAGAPADFLVGGEVLGRQGRQRASQRTYVILGSGVVRWSSER